MRCPHCGDKIHDPGLDRFCPSCGRDLPHESAEEKTVFRDRSISIILLIISITLIMLGFGFILPDLILRAIDPELGTMWWPYSIVILVVGIVLLVVRRPFAKRSMKFNAVILQKVERMWTCSFCGTENVPGSLKCESCGAPIKKN